MENIEIEYKVMVKKEDFQLLINELKDYPHQCFTQTNFYYDTTDFKIKNNKMSLRIRFIEELNQFILTLKSKIKDGHLEHEIIVLKNDVSAFDKYTINKLKNSGIDIHSIKQIGELKTIRYEIKTSKYNLCFDQNFYNQQEDYEIECETDTLENGKKIIDHYLGQRNIVYEKSKKSKIARALLSYKEEIC